MVTQIKREDLYEKIFETPLTKLAVEIGVSDVGLRKICKKLNIPLPGKGYHLRRNKVKVPLPDKADLQVYVIRKPPQPIEKRVLEQVPAILFEKQQQNRIVVSATLPIHPLAKLTETILYREKTDRVGRVSGRRAKAARALDISVSPGLVGRAIGAMSALITALSKRGHSVGIDSGGKTYVTIFGETIDIRLEERTIQKAHQPTPEEVEEARIYNWGPRVYDFFPTGQLSLTLTTRYGSNRRITDGRRGKIEERLNEFIIELLKAREELKFRGKAATALENKA